MREVHQIARETLEGNLQAKVKVLRERIETYQSAAGEGEKIFMLNMLPGIIAELVKTVDQVTIDKVSVIDASGTNRDGRGAGIGRFVTQFPAALVSLSEQIDNATGVNILSGLKRDSDPARPPAATLSEPGPYPETTGPSSILEASALFR